MERFKKAIQIAVIYFGIFSIQCVQGTEIIHYKNRPITISLSVGVEQSIQFGDHVQVGISKGQQSQRLFRIQSAQGAVHILPHKTFDKQRVQIKRLTDGRVILLDLIASEDVRDEAEAIRILLPFENTVASLGPNSNSQENDQTIGPIELTRYVAQQLYGPSRLHRGISGITKSTLNLPDQVKLFKGETLVTTVSEPLLVYQGGGYYITAFHVKNRTGKPVTLNYLALNVPFTHATFQHHSLSPKGRAGDSTVAYVISDRSPEETFYPWSYFEDVPLETLPETSILKDVTDSGAPRKRHQPK